jgi:hypothetical protein
LGARGEDQTPSLAIFSADAVITEKPDGDVQITASQGTFNSFKDWNDPDSNRAAAMVTCWKGDDSSAA